MIGKAFIDRVEYEVALWYNTKSKSLSGTLTEKCNKGNNGNIVLLKNGFKTNYDKKPDVDGKALIGDKKYKVALWRETKNTLSGTIRFNPNIVFKEFDKKVQDEKEKNTSLLNNLTDFYHAK